MHKRNPHLQLCRLLQMLRSCSIIDPLLGKKSPLTIYTRWISTKTAAALLLQAALLYPVLAQLPSTPTPTPSFATCQPRAGPEFRINTYYPGIQTSPVLASLIFPPTLNLSSECHCDPTQNILASSGSDFTETLYPGFVAVWTSLDQDGSGLGIYGQLYEQPGNNGRNNVSAPTKIGDEFAVNTVTTFDQRQPSVAALASGGFVVVFESTVLVGTAIPPQRAERILARVYAATGEPLGNEFMVSQISDAAILEQDTSPSVAGVSRASNGTSGFVVTWVNYSSDDPSDRRVLSRLFSVDGEPRGNSDGQSAATIVSAFSDPSIQDDVAVGSLLNGKYLIAWSARESIGSLVLAEGSPPFPLTIRGQYFDADGNEIGAEFRISGDTVGSADKFRPCVAGEVVKQGGYLLAWQNRAVSTISSGASLSSSLGSEPAASPSASANEATSAGNISSGIFARTYDRDGAPMTVSFLVNSFISNAVGDAKIAGRWDGGYVIVWDSRGQDGDAFGVYSQLYNSDGIREGPETLVNIQITGSQSLPSVAVVGPDKYIVSWASESQDPDGSTGVYGRVMQFCPNARNCILSDWSDWSPCSVSCGAGGSQSRNRTVLVEGKSPGLICGDAGATLETRTCNAQPCSAPASNGVQCSDCDRDSCYVPLPGLMSQADADAQCRQLPSCSDGSSCLIQVNDPTEQAYLVSTILPQFGSDNIWTLDVGSQTSSDQLCLVLATTGAILVPNNGCVGPYRGLCEVPRPLGCPIQPT